MGEGNICSDSEEEMDQGLKKTGDKFAMTNMIDTYSKRKRHSTMMTNYKPHY